MLHLQEKRYIFLSTHSQLCLLLFKLRAKGMVGFMRLLKRIRSIVDDCDVIVEDVAVEDGFEIEQPTAEHPERASVEVLRTIRGFGESVRIIRGRRIVVNQGTNGIRSALAVRRTGMVGMVRSCFVD